MPGAWVRRARLHAADGWPMPTKQTSVDLRAREAATVIISAGVKLSVISGTCGGEAEPAALFGERLRPLVEHVGLHPGQEAVAVARNDVPFLVIGVVALVVA